MTNLLPQRTMEEKNQEAQVLTLRLYSRFDKVLKDYSILRFYTNGVIKKFTAMINQVLEMWSSVEVEIPGQNLKQIKKMVNDQLANFRSTMPLECSWDEIKSEVEHFQLTMKERESVFEMKVLGIENLNDKLEYRTNFNNDLELEINKLIMAGKISRNFLTKLSNEVLSPLQSYMNMPSNPMFPGMDLSSFPMIQDMKDSAASFSSLLTDYKFYAQLRDQQDVFLEQNFDVNELINQIIEKYTLLTIEKDIDLFYKIDKNLPEKIQANRLLIEKLILSMLDNGMNILNISKNIQDVAQDKLKLTIEVLRTENWRSTWRISVEDSGVDFPTCKLNDVYSFFSLYSEMDPFAALKLKMMEEVVNFLGGALTIDKVGNGTSFFVEIGLDVA